MTANPGFWRKFRPERPDPQEYDRGGAGTPVHADHHIEEIGRRMEESMSARQAEVEQLNQKKDQIQKSKEGLNNALKNIKTRFGKLGLEVEDSDSAGTPCTISSFLCCRPAAVSKHSAAKILPPTVSGQRPKESCHHRH